MPTDIKQANKAYEDWLKQQLPKQVIETDLAKKWEKMSAGAFPFLRATFWRWSETIFDVCPDLAKAPTVLGVGDIHLENFGSWRDADGRLVWGVNDFDEAAEMPYALDLVRLACSALLARPSRDATAKDIAAAILKGYTKGLDNPRPITLDEDHAWLRTLVVVPEKDRAHFWEKVDGLTSQSPPDVYRKAIEAAMPDKTAKITIFSPRTAGTGSLGRPRWVGVANWRGGRIVREAKALVTSAWTRVPSRGAIKLRCNDIVTSQYRAPDPWYRIVDHIVVRRLSPNSRKIEVKDSPDALLDERMLATMGYELANIHLGTDDPRAAIKRDLASRKDGWLRDAAKAAAEAVTRDYDAWRKH